MTNADRTQVAIPLLRAVWSMTRRREDVIARATVTMVVSWLRRELAAAGAVAAQQR